jgi:16S rRNA (adenine1518-N6/adenine1519-N6)-dimethyltransferase
VASAIIRIWPRPARRAQVGDVPRFREFLRDLYAHRRKNLRGALASIPGIGLDKAGIDAKLAQLDIDGAARAETLSVENHQRLFAAFIDAEDQA